jgi:sugar phosphate isomerase/epimerase
MKQGISTHVFLAQRLTPGLLDALTRGGATAVEVFAARHHFDYADRGAVRELANWFRSNNVDASLHMPLFSSDEDSNWSRHTAPVINLIDLNKSTRIEAMDEVKRALESAEQIPFRSCVIHLGLKGDRWNTRALDDSMTAIEHLKAFSSPLGMQLLLENLNNEVATPAHLVEIVRAGHFDNVGFCLDTGHANLVEPQLETRDHEAKDGIAQAFEDFGDRIAELHLHDNLGNRPENGKDEHLWPGSGTIDWDSVAKQIAALKQPPVGILEIAHELGEDMKQIETESRAAWKKLGVVAQ